VQVMHNGLRVQAGGYYGAWMAHVIRGLKGHHEPQEELIFSHLLNYVRHGTCMVELGAYWSYYSLWYLKEVPDSDALCVEPDPHNLGVGVKNASLNGMSQRARFINAWIGGTATSEHLARTENSESPAILPVMNMDSIAAALIPRPIELIHMDIQGAEEPFIRSMTSALQQRLIRFAMVSTHHSSISSSKTTHSDCVELLRQFGANVLVEHDVIESYSGDGMILASFYPEDAALTFPEVSRNTGRTSLFKTA
jgi:FkbM family methyltransferase